MAKLNGMKIFVESEDVDYGVEVTEHVTETGVPLSDHVKRNAITLSISGEIVGKDASSIILNIKRLQRKGATCKYTGRVSLSKCVITSFSTSYSSGIWGGCEFSMTLKEIRTAKTSYGTTKSKSTQQTTKKSKAEFVYHTVKKGDCVWNLVAAPKAPYRKYGWSCEKVMKQNPDAFSRKGDFRTLKIGYKLKVGKR